MTVRKGERLAVFTISTYWKQDIFSTIAEKCARDPAKQDRYTALINMTKFIL